MVVNLAGFPGEKNPGLDDGVGVEGNAVDALVQEPHREIRIVGRTLAADPDVFPLFFADFDRAVEEPFHRVVSLVEG
jgi:hypothetical protein